RGTVPKDEFSFVDERRDRSDSIGTNIDGHVVGVDGIGFLHLRLTIRLLCRDVDWCEKTRVRKNILARQLFREKRAADFETARFEDVVRQSPGEKEVIVFFQKQFDKRCFGLKLRATENRE